jgi:hypothetical protein
MFKWTSIEGFHNVRKLLKTYPDLHEGTIAYRAKVKLHGTNGGVAIYPDGRVEAQSRTSVLSPKEDNSNFCKQCVLANEDFWSKFADDHTITIYGEWCGPGIEKGTAINKTEEKLFAIFAIQLGDSITDEFGYDHATTVIEPLIISRILSAGGELPSNVRVLPWYGDGIIVDFADTESMQSAVDIMNGVVETVEAIDPWVKETFGIEGMGEGVVYYPISFSNGGNIDRHQMSTFSFKAKGEKHKNTKTKKAVQIDPEVAASIDDFVTMVVTPARLDQGARAVAGGELDFDQRYIGPFLKWMGQDVKKETSAELEASDLKWDQVVKPVGTAARTWYLEKFKEL